MSDAGSPELMDAFYHYMADQPFIPGADLIDKFHNFRIGWIACTVYIANIHKQPRGKGPRS